MSGRPHAYLRKSAVRDLTASFSPETQEREVRALAQRFGDNGDRLVIKADWDISGAGKYTRKRLGYLEAVAAIESGECSALYSYSLSRLGRSVHELTALFDLCRDRGVPIRLVADAVDTSTASGTMMANILASVAQFESQVASERRLAQNATKKARGQSLRTRRQYGEAEGEDAARVLTLYRETGSYTATARRLNAEGVPARSGRQWWAASVKLVVRRLDPAIRSEGRGRNRHVATAFARLLRCPFCQTLLTPASAKGYQRYVCSNRAAVAHPAGGISERRLTAWIMAESAHFDTGRRRGVLATDDDAQRRGEIERRKRDLQDRLFDLDPADILAERAEIERLERAPSEPTGEPLFTFPAVLWSDDPAAVNTQLRALWECVELGPDMMPVRAVWRHPETRSETPVALAVARGSRWEAFRDAIR